ncbi:hypothetical protein F4778DRAFT_705269 [Xylariomycetidae sp. FL2044]|nr:hypothetical protein F4778DRAFT_705269 [Xylariomycetidae sp. FL2044]
MSSSSLLVALHLVPVISSTSSLWYAWDQYEQLTLFRHKEMKSLSNQVIPPYFTAFFKRGVPRALGLLATTTLSCASILRYSSEVSREKGAFPWYVAALALAVSHLAWAPSVIPHVKAIENDAKEKNLVHLEHWLRLHVWRSLTVDIGAWICCVAGTVLALS